MIRRAVLPFAISTIVISVAFMLWALPAPSAARGYMWREVELVLIWVSPFTALGLLLLLPVTWLTGRTALSATVRLAILVFVGAALGTLLFLPLAEMLTFDLLIGTAAGAFSAAIWALLNWDRLARATAVPR